MDSLQHFDPQGYAIPWVADDPITEAGLDDPDYGEPAGWPAWTDAHVWAPGPQPDPDDTGEFEPAHVPGEGPAEPDDDDDFEELDRELSEEWRPPYEEPGPTAEDLAEYELWLDRLDTLHALAAADEHADRAATMAALREAEACR